MITKNNYDSIKKKSIIYIGLYPIPILDFFSSFYQILIILNILKYLLIKY